MFRMISVLNRNLPHKIMCVLTKHVVRILGCNPILRALFLRLVKTKNYFSFIKLCILVTNFRSPGSAIEIIRLLQKMNQEEILYLRSKLEAHYAKNTSNKKIICSELAIMEGYLNNKTGAEKYFREFLDIVVEEKKKAVKSKVFDVNDARGALEKIKEVLDQANTCFFLISGTLLSAVRNKKFIPYDYDLDLGVFDTDTNMEQLVGLFEGVKNIVVSYDFTCEDRVLLVYKNTITIDLFIHKKVPQGMWHGDQPTGGWINSDFTLKEILFYDKNYWIPEDYDRYLSENYIDWKSPSLFYHPLFDTPNVDLDSSEHLLSNFISLISINIIKERDRFIAQSHAQVLYDRFGIYSNKIPLKNAIKHKSTTS